MERKYTLIRQYIGEKGTLGALFRPEDDWDRPWLYTLELPAGDKTGKPGYAILAGEYKLILSQSNRFKKVLPELLSVPGRSGIRIHAGNFVSDTQGCILLGAGRNIKETSVLYSQGAMKIFMQDLQEHGSRGSITIC